MKPLGRLLKRFLGGRKAPTSFSVFLVAAITVGAILTPSRAFAIDSATLVDAAEVGAVWLSTMIMWFVNIFGKMIALITEVVLVNVMTYNGFATSPVIGAGWSVVRDVMNMGFVVVLLVIAVVTIFGGNVGSWTVKWQQQIPKLLLFAILINFSRMICTFLIDIGQVVMLTFANAIKDVAGGNIIQVFGLSDFVKLDTDALEQLVSTNQGLTAFDLLAAAVLALLMTMAVLGTMMILTVILVYRIVVLWVLVVISPLAFFFGGADVLRGGAGDPYADWWKRFTGAIAIGPVLVFFLWLTLSVAGQGNIAAVENFPEGASASALGEVGNATGFATNIAQPGRLLSFLLGLGMLFVGFEASQKFASALPGAASKLIQGGVRGAIGLGGGTALLAGGRLAGAGGKGLAKGVVFAGKGGLALGGAAIRKTGQTATGQAARGAVGRFLIDQGARATNLPGFAAIGRMTGRLGASLEQSRRQGAAQRLQDHSEAVKDYNKDEIDAGLATKAITPDGVMRQNALRWKVLNSSYLRKKYTQPQLAKMYQEFADSGGEDAMSGDSNLAQDFAKMKKTRPDLLNDKDRTELFATMNDSEFMDMDAAAFRHHAVREEAKKRTRYEHRAKKVLNDDGSVKLDQNGREVWEGGYVDFHTLMERGRIGKRDQQQAFKEAEEEGLTIDPKMASESDLRGLGADQQTGGLMKSLAEEGKLEILMENPNFQIEKMPMELLGDMATAKKINDTVAPEVIAKLSQDPEKAKAFKEALRKHIQGGAVVGGEGPTDGQKKLGASVVTLAESPQELEEMGYYTNAGGRGRFENGGEQYVAQAAQNNPHFLVNVSAHLETKNAFSDKVLENINVRKLNQAARKAPEDQKPAFEKLYDVIDQRLEENIRTMDAERSRLYRDRGKDGASAAEIRRIDAELRPLESDIKAARDRLSRIRKGNPSSA